MSDLELATDGERKAVQQYLGRLLALDHRAVVRLQAQGTALGIWAGPPFEVVSLRPAGLSTPVSIDATVSAQRLLDRVLDGPQVDLPPRVSGPSWVGLLPPRAGWSRHETAEVSVVRGAVERAKDEFGLQAPQVTDPGLLQQLAHRVWERPCLAEVPTRCAHAADFLGLMGPGDGTAIAYATDTWLRLAVPGGSVATRRDLLPQIGVMPVMSQR